MVELPKCASRNEEHVHIGVPNVTRYEPIQATRRLKENIFKEKDGARNNYIVLPLSNLPKGISISSNYGTTQYHLEFPRTW